MATNFQTYDQQGEKLSFANWISMISPEDTPFLSMTGKESINEVMFSWQTDRLSPVDPDNAYAEGSAAYPMYNADATAAPYTASKDAGDTMIPTTVLNGYTQILRRTVQVSDTANVISAYGRGRELQYQMEKGARALKRDLETILLSDQVGSNGGTTAGGVRKLDGFQSQVAKVADPDTGATVFRHGLSDYSNFESDLFDLTLALYTAGAECDVIMINPAQANIIAGLQESDGSRLRMFENTKQFIKQVNSITDPLGQTFKVIINRWMPANTVYVFNSSDWTQMVLRAPKRVQLAKTGSAENWMIEMEVGLRHRNPYASGVLVFDTAPEALTVTGGANLDNGANEVVTASKGAKAAKA